MNKTISPGDPATQHTPHRTALKYSEAITARSRTGSRSAGRPFSSVYCAISRRRSSPNRSMPAINSAFFRLMIWVQPPTERSTRLLCFFAARPSYAPPNHGPDRKGIQKNKIAGFGLSNPLPCNLKCLRHPKTTSLLNRLVLVHGRLPRKPTISEPPARLAFRA